MLNIYDALSYINIVHNFLCCAYICLFLIYLVYLVFIVFWVFLE